MRILILANHYNTLRIFRRELIIAMKKEGHEVIVSIPECDDENRQLLESYGCKVIFTEMDRRGTNPLKDMGLMLRYVKLLGKVRPDKVITYTVKPNIYGGLACMIRRIPQYANITGLGSAFEAEGGMMRMLLTLMYRVGLCKAVKVFFENPGNRRTAVKAGMARKERTVVMPGAGVNLTEFYPAEYPSDDSGVNFLFVGRIMQEKGVDELFRAIRTIKSKYPKTSFSFIGWYEDSYEELVGKLESEGLIHFYGFQPDVRPYIENAHCVILPSWHEGMSNTLLEAASMCRPLITNDIHGCMEAVVDGKTGFLTRKKDTADLTEKIEEMILLSNEEREAMGLLGRQYMKKRFDKNMVVEKTMTELGL